MAGDDGRSTEKPTIRATRSARQAGWPPRSSPTRCSPWIQTAITREAVTAAIQDVKAYPSDLNCGDWYFGPGDRHNSNHAGRIVTINDAGEYELVEDCHEHADPELEDILALEESEGLGG